MVPNNPATKLLACFHCGSVTDCVINRGYHCLVFTCLMCGRVVDTQFFDSDKPDAAPSE